MAPVYPTRQVLIDLDDDRIPETDITSRVVSDITGQYGSPNAKETDRTATAGTCTFQIENKDAAYTGIDLIGKVVSVRLIYSGITKQIFFGRILPGTEIDSGTVLPLRIKVTVGDWLNTANDIRIPDLAIAVNKTADQAFALLLAAIYDPPAHTNFSVGAEPFKNMFDGSAHKAKVYSEIDKITKSDLGLTYLRFRDYLDGETLRFENRFVRGYTTPISRIPDNVSTPPFLKFHGNAGASGSLKFHGNAGASGKLKVHDWQDASFSALHYKADWRGGRYLLNEMTVANVLRRTDTSDVTFFTLGAPIPIGTGQTEEFRGTYTDPSGGAIIWADDPVTKNYISDLAFNSKEDGTGTDYTANVRAVLTSFANNFVIAFRNSGPAGYVTAVKVKGRGIYKYNPTEQLIENVKSKKALLLEQGEAIVREYSNGVNWSKLFGRRAIALNGMPRRELGFVSYNGNASETRLLAFMYLDIGDKPQIGDNYPSYTGEFYIHGIKFKIGLNGSVDYTWFLREEIESMCTPLAVKNGSNTGGNRNALDFGILPYMANMPQFTISLWVKRTNSAGVSYLISHSVDIDGVVARCGWYLSLNSFGTLTFDSYKSGSTGRWWAPGAFTTLNTWTHIMLTYDNTTDTADPILYINGVVESLTEVITPSGSSNDDSQASLIIHNIGPNLATGDAYNSALGNNTLIKDPRVYNRICAAEEAAAIAAAEDDYTTVPEGRIFNGIFAPTDNIGDFIGDTLDSDDWVVDIIRGAPGVPYAEVPNDTTQVLTGEAI